MRCAKKERALKTAQPYCQDKEEEAELAKAAAEAAALTGWLSWGREGGIEHSPGGNRACNSPARQLYKSGVEGRSPRENCSFRGQFHYVSSTNSVGFVPFVAV